MVTSVCHHWDVAAAVVIINEAGGLNLTSDNDGALMPLSMWNGARYENDTETFEKMRKWRGNLIAAAPNMAHFLQRNLRLVE
jgi:fructose-1,6-bisphosphatase/inositol monophosphatase family enzyme